MSTQKRQYRLKARAEGQMATRLRIIEAAAALHEEVGPARTTVVEIARRAGVQRPTVYNNFPDDGALFEACGAHWMAAHPFPDMSSAMAETDPGVRLDLVLTSLYGWYRENQRSNEHLQRDRLVLPALDLVMKVRMDQQMDELASMLASEFSSAANPPRVRAAVALALDFWTWRRLSHEGVVDSDAARLMMDSVKAAAGMLN
jgi:AcrR family transcriptional regulator